MKCGAPNVSRIARLGPAVITAVSILGAGFFCASASASVTPIGSLSADQSTYRWRPVNGEELSGVHDALGLNPRDHGDLKRVFCDSGVIAPGGVIGPTSLFVLIQMDGAKQTTISISHAEPPPQNPLQWRAGHPVTVPAGEFWPGDVFSFGGDVTIQGEVGGNVVAIDASVTIGEAATVRGNVVVIGGLLRQRGDGKIYGSVFAPDGHRRPRLSVARAWEFEESGLDWTPMASYDRVDGLRTGVKVGFKTSPYAPQATLFGGYGFASQRWQYRFDVRLRLARSINLEAGGSVFRLTDTEDEPWVGRDANTVYAAVAGSDYRDYYGSDGGAINLVYKYRDRGVLSVEYRNTDYRHLEAHPHLWHLVRPGHDFRENFSTLDPDQFDALLERLERRGSSVILTVGVEPMEIADADHPPRRFDGSMSASLEVAGGGLGGGLDYIRLILKAGGSWQSGNTHQVAARAWYGDGRRDLPPNKLFFLGGVGSLPGYAQKVFVGDESFLANVEYRYNYWKNQYFDGGIILFFDVGRAGTHAHFWDLNEFKPDVGVGLGLGDEVRVDLAKGLDESERSVRVSVRLEKPF
ncbi:MAG: BamA/TamA family outer membrane protein [candidate division Zixibacteria bacterium]|nr:BamA/TamA family outer membrane protein [candidate division Zixibacteria bacterium]